MKNDEDIVLQPGPRRSRDASNLPDVDTAVGSDLELESGPASRTEPKIPFAHCEPAHVRHREASCVSGKRAVRPRGPEPSSPTVSYRSDEAYQIMLLGRQPTKSGSRPMTTAEPPAYI